MRVMALHPERLQVRVAHGEPKKKSFDLDINEDFITYSKQDSDRTYRH